MLFLALAVGVAVGAADDDADWHSKTEKKSTPVRSLADDWEDDAPVKRTTRAVKPSLRQINGKDDDFDNDSAKQEQWGPKSSDKKSPEKSTTEKKPPVKKATDKSLVKSEPAKSAPKAVSIKPGSEVRIDEQVKKASAAEPDNDDSLPILGDAPQPPKIQRVSAKAEPLQPPTESTEAPKSEAPKPAPTKLPELPKGLGAPKPAPKVLEVGPNEPQTQSKQADEPAPKIQKGLSLPTLPKPVTPKTDAPPPPKPVAPTTTGAPPKTDASAPIKPVPKTQTPEMTRPLKTPVPPAVPIGTPMPPPNTGAPIPAPTTTQVELAPIPKVVADGSLPPIAPPFPAPMPTEQGAVEDSTNICMPLMDAASAWRFTTRSFILSWDQPGTRAFLRDAVSGTGVVSGVDYDFDKQFGQEFSLERRFDSATAMVITGLVTEDARRHVGAIAFGGLDLGIDGPGSGALRDLSGFSGRATSRLWKVDLDFVQHFLREPDAPIRARIWIGPEFIGLKETYAYIADGAPGTATFDTRTINTLFGGDIGGAVTFQPWYSNLGIDVSARYGVFGNVFDIRSAFAGPGGAIVVEGDDDNSRFATAFELNVEATLRIARNVCLLGGWRLWNIQGVGRAIAQTPTNIAGAALATAGNGNLFAHGLFLGASIGWGGSADPNCRYGGARPYILREQ